MSRFQVDALGNIINEILSLEEYTDKLLSEEESEQVGGNHYAQLGIEPRKIIKENKLNFNEGNVLKYLLRHKNKNGAEDIKKAIQYLEFILEDTYGE